MPKKKTDAGREYDIDGKRLTWHPLDDDDKAGNLPDVVLPLRIKLKVIRAIGDADMTPDKMFEFLESLVPHQSDTLDEMDVNDFVAMFQTWQSEYNALSGASLGE